MRKNFLILLTGFLFAFGLSSCYYDVESQLYPNSNANCDTLTVTYSTTIRNILQNNSCLGCHSGSAVSGGNIVLDNYNSVKTYAQNGRLYGSVSHGAGYSPMPQGGNKISSCNILQIKKWIDSGILNN